MASSAAAGDIPITDSTATRASPTAPAAATGTSRNVAVRRLSRA